MGGLERTRYVGRDLRRTLGLPRLSLGATTERPLMTATLALKTRRPTRSAKKAQRTLLGLAATRVGLELMELYTIPKRGMTLLPLPVRQLRQTINVTMVGRDLSPQSVDSDPKQRAVELAARLHILAPTREAALIVVGGFTRIRRPHPHPHPRLRRPHPRPHPHPHPRLHRAHQPL